MLALILALAIFAEPGIAQVSVPTVHFAQAGSAAIASKAFRGARKAGSRPSSPVTRSRRCKAPDARYGPAGDSSRSRDISRML